MVFSSAVFLFVFLPIVFFGYWIVRRDLRLYFLLFSSLIFYAWGNPYHVFLLLVIAWLSYILALLMDKAATARTRRFWLAVAVVLPLGLLFRYKYLDFVLQIFGEISGYSFAPHHYTLPLGISFFTFQSLSYVFDVYRREVKAQNNFLKLALYISFFPQVIAGPIVKYHDIIQDITHNDVKFEDISVGIKCFIVGLGKKVLLANPLGMTADRIFDEGALYADFTIAWIGAVAYSLQLYFDFSGYSDMAIGLGRVFGFHFKENFSHPYMSKSVTEFWRRWHISLGAWFREYLYIPLGGSWGGKYRTYGNLLAVFLITGLWHGAAWTFVVWGVWHGLFVVLERAWGFGGGTYSPPKFVRHGYTILVFILGWVMFRSYSVEDGFLFWRAMFGLYNPEKMLFTVDYYLTTKFILVAVLAILGCTTLIYDRLAKCVNSASVVLQGMADIYFFMVLLLSIVFLVASSYNPFIYFRF